MPEAMFDDYRTDSTYEINYTRDISPSIIQLALLMQGVVLPERDGQPFRYLELGNGFGLSTNIHASGYGGEFWANDFMPEHVSFAQKLADVAGNGAHLLQKSFAELDEMSESGELPQFDVIAFHGIWSWINEQNRRHIINVVNSNLKPGGAVYVSYNALPGWSHFLPVRELMRMYSDRLGEDRDILDRLKETLQFMDALAESDATFFRFNPLAKIQLGEIKKYPVKYLAQEYLNRSWNPFYFTEVSKDFAAIGCSFVSSASMLTQTGALVPPDTRKLLAEMLNSDSRETLRDFARNTRFRSDLFVRDVKRLNSRDLASRLDACKLMLAHPRERIRPILKTPYGTMELDEKIYGPIFDSLSAEDARPKTIGEIFSSPGLEKVNQRLKIECVSVIVGMGWVDPALDGPTEERIDSCHRLNRALCAETASGTMIKQLASPVTGIGVGLSDFEQNLLLTRKPGGSTPEEWVSRVLENYLKRGDRLDYAKVTAKMLPLVKEFQEWRLPFLEKQMVPFAPE